VGQSVDDGKPGLVVKPMEGWTSVYSAAMQLPPPVMRNLARAAGAHIWLETDDALYTDGQFVGVHAASDGVKEVFFPGRYRVRERISGQTLTENATSVSIPMRRAETVLLELEPCE
jgi:hypothetical protein